MVYNRLMNNSEVMNEKKRHPGMFQPGVSGNPSGRPKQDFTVRDLAKTHTEGAVHTLAEIMKNPKVAPSARVHAASELLNRAWGKPTVAIESVSTTMNYQDWLKKIAEEEGIHDEPSEDPLAGL